MFELFDVQVDLYKLVNLAGRDGLATTERGLRAALQEKMIRHRDYLPLPDGATRGVP